MILVWGCHRDVLDRMGTFLYIDGKNGRNMSILEVLYVSVFVPCIRPYFRQWRALAHGEPWFATDKSGRVA